MRYMMIVKHALNQGPPPKKLIDEITTLTESEAAKATLLGNGGLQPLSTGARVRLSGGKITLTDGPYIEAKEIIGGYAQFELRSKEEAIDAATRFMELHQLYWPGWEGETEIRAMLDPGDCGANASVADTEPAHAVLK